MKKFILGVCCIFVFSGCTETKHSIKLECKNGYVFYSIYKAEFVAKGENIKHPKFLTSEGYYNNEGRLLKCTEE